MQNQPNSNNVEGQNPIEKRMSPNPGAQSEQAPEAAPAPVSPEKPASTEIKSGGSAAETFSDQPSAAPAQPVQTPQDQPEPSASAQPVPPSNLPVSEDQEAEDVSELDKSWVQAVEKTIEKDKDKPYEEEEDSEQLQTKYLKKRFGKDIPKEE